MQQFSRLPHKLLNNSRLIMTLAHLCRLPFYRTSRRRSPMTVLSVMRGTRSRNLLKASGECFKVYFFLFRATRSSIHESSGFQQVLSVLWITHHWSTWPPGHGPWIQVWTDPPQSAWCRSRLGCRLQKQNKPWIVNVKYGYGQTYQTSLLSNKPIISPASADLEILFHHWNLDVFSTSKDTKSPLKSCWKASCDYIPIWFMCLGLNL